MLGAQFVGGEDLDLAAAHVGCAQKNLGQFLLAQQLEVHKLVQQILERIVVDRIELVRREEVTERVDEHEAGRQTETEIARYLVEQRRLKNPRRRQFRQPAPVILQRALGAV